jgi:hypothetical protein
VGHAFSSLDSRRQTKAAKALNKIEQLAALLIGGRPSSEKASKPWRDTHGHES